MRSCVRGFVLGLALIAGPVCSAPAALLKMDTATQARLGITTAPLQSAHRSAAATGFARALDPTPLAQLDSDITAAVAALAASQAEAARTKALNAADQTVSKQAAEAAAAQSRADAAKLTLLRRRVGLEWGPALARLSDAGRSKLVAGIAAGRVALVRIDAAGGLSQLSGSATLDLGAGGRAMATILGPTRTSDPRLQSTGLLAQVSGAQAVQLGAGAVVPAAIVFGSGADGVVIPREALLRGGGEIFVYVRRDPGSFERRTVRGAVGDPAGLFTAQGFHPGEPVVVAGASQLFAAQSAKAASADKED